MNPQKEGTRRSVMSVQKDIDQSLWLYSKISPYVSGQNRKSSDEHMMQCPFCDEAHTSSHPWNAMRGCYFIYQQKFYCYRCGCTKSGLELYEALSGQSARDLIPEYMSFVRRSGCRGVNFSNYSSVRTSRTGAGTDRPEDEFIPIPDRMRNPLTERGLKYLESRKTFLSPNLPGYARFYSASYNCKADGREYEAVVIPWYLDGEVWTYQWRFIDSDIPLPKYGFPKSAGKRIYGIDSVDTSFPYLVCCEGVFDSLWVKNGIAIGGKKLTDNQRAILSERFPRHRVVYGFDNDLHGLKAMTGNSVSDDPNALVFYWKDVSGGAKDLGEFAVNGDETYFFDGDRLRTHFYSPLSLRMKLSNPFK